MFAGPLPRCAVREDAPRQLRDAADGINREADALERERAELEGERARVQSAYEANPGIDRSGWFARLAEYFDHEAGLRDRVAPIWRALGVLRAEKYRAVVAEQREIEEKLRKRVRVSTPGADSEANSAGRTGLGTVGSRAADLVSWWRRSACESAKRKRPARVSRAGASLRDHGRRGTPTRSPSNEGGRRRG